MECQVRPADGKDGYMFFSSILDCCKHGQSSQCKMSKVNNALNYYYFKNGDIKICGSRS